MVMVLVIPPPVTVIVPVLEDVPVLAVAFSVIFPLFEPLDGDTVSHDVALLLAVHDTFEVIDTDVFDAVAAGLHDVVLTVRLTALVTVTE